MTIRSDYTFELSELASEITIPEGRANEINLRHIDIMIERGENKAHILEHLATFENEYPKADTTALREVING